MFEVVLTREAQRVFREADPPLARKLARCLAQLELDPRSTNNVRALRGLLAGFHR